MVTKRPVEVCRSMFRSLISLSVVLGISTADAQELTPHAMTRPHRSQPSEKNVQALGSPPSATVEQFALGSIAALVAGYGLFVAFDNPEGADRRVKGDEGFTPNANTAFVVGSYLGAAGGVSWTGRRRSHRGTWAGALLGGAVVALPVAFLTRNEPMMPPLGFLIVAPLHALATTVGYQVSR